VLAWLVPTTAAIPTTAATANLPLRAAKGMPITGSAEGSCDLPIAALVTPNPADTQRQRSAALPSALRRVANLPQLLFHRIPITEYRIPSKSGLHIVAVAPASRRHVRETNDTDGHVHTKIAGCSRFKLKFRASHP